MTVRPRNPRATRLVAERWRAPSAPAEQRAAPLRARDALLPPVGRTAPRRAPSLPFSTPEQMLAAHLAGKPAFDLSAMTDAGTRLRRSGFGPGTAAAIGFEAPAGKLSPAELVAALRRIDVGPLVRAGIKPTAVLDFDNTLAAGDVLTEFADALSAKAVFPDANADALADILARGTAQKPSDFDGKSSNAIMELASRKFHEGELAPPVFFFMVLAAIRGMRIDELTAHAEQLFAHGAPGKPPYKTRFFDKDGAGSAAIAAALRERGVEPHIITLGLGFVAKVGARYLGIKAEHVHGYELEVIDGRITGRAVDVKLYGKHVACDTYVSRVPLFAFGDSKSTDTPMLARATARAFVVDPKPEFHDFIAERGADLTWLSYR